MIRKTAYFKIYCGAKVIHHQHNFLFYYVTKEHKCHFIIYNQHNFLFYTCYKFFSHHRSSTMGSFGFHYADVDLNIEHTVADGISNRNAHGPYWNDFTSPFYFQNIFTIRILFAIFWK